MLELTVINMLCLIYRLLSNHWKCRYIYQIHILATRLACLEADCFDIRRKIGSDIAGQKSLSVRLILKINTNKKSQIKPFLQKK